MGYIPHTEADRRAMLQRIGVGSIDELFADIPANLRLGGALDVPPMLDEQGIFEALSKIAARNVDAVSFLGAGIYDHFIPSIVQTVLQRGEFLSAYTPYQPELSQGNLQAIYEFQTMICELTGMEIANASMYDAGSALAEAALMAHSINDRPRIAMSAAVHPHYRECVRTYAWALGIDVVELPFIDGVTDAGGLDDKTSCLLVQSPNFFGNIEDLGSLIGAAHRVGALGVVCADPVSLSLLKPPGEFGADIVVAEGQGLGWPTGFGGPLLGLFTCKEEFVRRIPGRIVGRTTDIEGRRGFVMTLRTREQDIRREKATSNICTNEALIALAATVFLCAVGKHGLRAMGEVSLQNAHYAAERMRAAGLELTFPKAKFFKEFAVRVPGGSATRDRLLDAGFIAGLPLGDYYPDLGDSLLVAVTEKRTKDEIDRFVEALAR